MGKVRRVYVEKKAPYRVHSLELSDEIRDYLHIDSLKGIRVLVRYDIENISDETFGKALGAVFSEPPVDILYEEQVPLESDARSFSIEYLPGQFDQRADSAEQCVKLLNEKEDPVIRTATTYIVEGNVSDEDFERIKAYCINPVDSRVAKEEKPETLVTVFETPADVAVISGFTAKNDEELEKLYASLGLAMTFADFKCIRDYFGNEEKRDPSITEIRVLDTYWSDHCRHTTFQTELKNVGFGEGFCTDEIKATYDRYLNDRAALYKGRDDKFVCLMDIATMGMKLLKKQGKLDDMEVSDEINACSVIVPVEIDGKTEEWLVFFKNETHNHPTEIEPFGGAATCLGGAIRDPLSGRGYVYQAMRVTGAADPTLPLKDTLKGKLPQRKITTLAAKGYSSYGNQIGLATGLVDEVYHPDYVAKRMEIGAVMGAAPRSSVIRENSDPGDMIILMGGRTGRDGCGGATGSSKAHTAASIETCGAEVQKGNAPTERKLQRLFRKPEVSRLIKKCNDFGAGGVSVAIGELAPGLDIDLDAVPKKYAGLDGTELAISESQERMAVVVAPGDVDKMLAFAAEENLEATVVARVTENPRLVMKWRGKEIVNVSRAFLDTNGAHQTTDAFIEAPSEKEDYFKTGAAYSAAVNGSGKEPENEYTAALADLNVCSKQGLVEMFDSSIGANTILMPYGGRNLQTPIQTMAAKLPVLSGSCRTATLMSYGFDPFLSKWSPYHGAMYAVAESVAKIVAAGGDRRNIRFTFQEYFEKPGTDPKRWGKPLAALLGAYRAQLGFECASIGGKDSMSGSFEGIDVPPTLVSFAVSVEDQKNIISPEFKKAGNSVILLNCIKDEKEIPDFDKLKEMYSAVTELIRSGIVVSAYALGRKGVLEAVAKMGFGNGLGADLSGFDTGLLLKPGFGGLILEADSERIADAFRPLAEFGADIIGVVSDEPVIALKDEQLSLDELKKAWSGTLEKVFATGAKHRRTEAKAVLYDAKRIFTSKTPIAEPTVFIPVFPGTNCEYDVAKRFETAGARVVTEVFANLNGDMIRDSVERFEKAIKNAQMIMFPGGFSAGDEPDGSGKFIANVFRNVRIADAVNDLLKTRDGLVLGICNGFQAVVKLGLVPYGEICEQKDDSPTLVTNAIGRHMSKPVYTKIVSNNSPWLAGVELGSVRVIPASHGEGRFVASEEWLDRLEKNGQIATQYVDHDGKPSMDEAFNPNGSYRAIEGILSPDGRVLGKMAHSERIGEDVAINVYGEQDQKIFESGVKYFKG